MMIKLVFSIIAAAFLVLPAMQVCTAENVPEKGTAFPAITLPIPEKDAERAYLGLTGKGTFTIPQIKAEVVILEIYSMYCPYCQKEAPIVNDLYQAIDKKSGLKEKIKIIGIGAGNTNFELDVFRNQYNVPFPLFADESYIVHKKVGEVRTPHFFVLKMNTDGSNKIIYSKVGSIQDPARFLDLILQESGLK
jgi:peroxiredoxin